MMVGAFRRLRFCLQSCLYVCLIGLALPVNAGPADIPPQILSDIDHYISDTVLPDVPGASLVIVADGKVMLLKGYGVRNTATHEQVTPDTVFRLASVSKGFASAAAGLLVKEKRLSWDEKIQPRFKNLRFKNQTYGHNITLWNLLSHTTGLIPHAYTNLVEDHVPYPDILQRLKNVDFSCMPGKCYGYQNVVFSLVGDIIQQTTGDSYEEFVVNSLFVPLGMENASFGLDAFLGNGNVGMPHENTGDHWSPVRVSDNFYNVAPAAGVNASARDMSQWLLAQLGHRQDVLPDALLDTLHAPAIETRLQQVRYLPRKGLGKVYYGLGWRIFDYRQFKSFVHHSGGVKGSRADMLFNRELQTGMVFLSNSENRHGVELMFRFLEAMEDYHKQRASGQLPQTLTLQMAD